MVKLLVLLLLGLSGAASSRGDVASALMQWLEDGGAFIPSVEVFERSDGERGIRTRFVVPEGETFFVIPQSLFLAIPGTFDNSENFSARLKDTSNSQRQEFAVHSYPSPEIKEKTPLDLVFDDLRSHNTSSCLQLCVFILHHYFSANSSFRPFIDSWPLHFPSAQVFHSNISDLDPAAQILLSQRRQDFESMWTTLVSWILPRYPHMFPQDLLTRSAFMWAFSAVTSRGWKVQQTGVSAGIRDNVPCIVPFVDMLNHRPGAPILDMPGEGDEGGPAWLVADRDYSAGEEVFVSYGSLSKAEALVHYGFEDATPGYQPEDELDA